MAQDKPMDMSDLEKGPPDYIQDKVSRDVDDMDISLALKQPTRSLQDADLTQEKGAKSSDDVQSKGKDQGLRLPDDAFGTEESLFSADIKTVKSQAGPLTEVSGEDSILPAPRVEHFDPAATEKRTPLTPADFYLLLGLNPPTVAKNDPRRLAQPQGFYSAVEKATRDTHRRHLMFALAYAIFSAVQFVVSVVFLAIGAVSDDPLLITLGAVSIIAFGFLAYMDSQQLPRRLRAVKASLRKVESELEDLYQNMRSGRQVFYEEVRKVREDYVRVLEEDENNRINAWPWSMRDIAQEARRVAKGQGHKDLVVPPMTESSHDPFLTSKGKIPSLPMSGKEKVGVAVPPTVEVPRREDSVRLGIIPSRPLLAAHSGSVRHSRTFESVSTGPWTNSIRSIPSFTSLATEDRRG